MSDLSLELRNAEESDKWNFEILSLFGSKKLKPDQEWFMSSTFGFSRLQLPYGVEENYELFHIWSSERRTEIQEKSKSWEVVFENLGNGRKNHGFLMELCGSRSVPKIR